MPKIKPIREDFCAECGSTFYRGNEGVPCKSCDKATCTDACRPQHKKKHTEVTHAKS